MIYAIVLLFMRGKTVPGTDFALGAMVLPSLIGMSIAFGGLMGPAGTIAVDREDGTLLRAKATPNGMIGYLVGKIVMFALTSLVSIALLVIPGAHGRRGTGLRRPHLAAARAGLRAVAWFPPCPSALRSAPS